MKRALLLVVAAGCGAAARPLPQGRAPAGDELVLYRDLALMKHRISVVVPEASRAHVTFIAPAGVASEDISILDPGELTVSVLSSANAAPPDDEPEGEVEEDAPLRKRASPPVRARTTNPTPVTFEVGAPRAGTYTLTVAYVTDRIGWKAAYTMTTLPARTQASLRGALAIRNDLGAPLAHLRTFVVDSELGPWRGHIAERVAAKPDPAAAPPRFVGDLDLAVGESRIELLPDDAPRAMHAVLVYDPIGTALDLPGARPSVDATLGTDKAVASVTESFEVARPHATSEGLPEGPVRLLERQADGSLTVLGESRLFDAATRVATVDTISLGTADGVTGARERREITVDEDNKKISEDFVISIENKRSYPVEVVLREHLYRGQNWTLAYQTADEPTKEGPQQISLRTIAPAHGTAKVLYVVVYTGL